MQQIITISEDDCMKDNKPYNADLFRLIIKKFLVAALVPTIALMIFGCSPESDSNKKTEDSPLKLLRETAPEKTVAILINMPTEDQLKEFVPTGRLVLEDSLENFLLIPSEKVEEVSIWELEFDGSDFTRKQSVFSNFNPEDEYILQLVTMRPEGGPHFELSLISDDGETSYDIAYDGKDGSPNIEYIRKE